MIVMRIVIITVIVVVLRKRTIDKSCRVCDATKPTRLNWPSTRDQNDVDDGAGGSGDGDDEPQRCSARYSYLYSSITRVQISDTRTRSLTCTSVTCVDKFRQPILFRVC